MTAKKLKFRKPILRFWNAEQQETFEGPAVRCTDCYELRVRDGESEQRGWELIKNLKLVGDRIIYPHHKDCPSKDNPA